MNKFTVILVAAGLASLASAPAFASQAGGPDPSNPVPHKGALANWNEMFGLTDVMGPAPTASVEAITGGPPSDPVNAVVPHGQ